MTPSLPGKGGTGLGVDGAAVHSALKRYRNNY